MWKILAFIFILIMCSSYCWVEVVSSGSGVDVLEAGMVWGLLRESSVSLISLAWPWCNGKDVFHKQVHESPGFCWILPMVFWVRNPLSLHGVMSEYWAEAQAFSQVTGLCSWLSQEGREEIAPLATLVSGDSRRKLLYPRENALLWVCYSGCGWSYGFCPQHWCLFLLQAISSSCFPYLHCLPWDLAPFWSRLAAVNLLPLPLPSVMRGGFSLLFLFLFFLFLCSSCPVPNSLYVHYFLMIHCRVPPLYLDINTETFIITVQEQWLLVSVTLFFLLLGKSGQAENSGRKFALLFLMWIRSEK